MLSFQHLKSDLINVSSEVIDENLLFVVETDVSDVAVSATLNQTGKPVTFYSRSLSKCEQAHSSVEKKVTALAEAVCKWSHLLTGKCFQIITDQCSVSFMYDDKNCRKI